MKRLATLLFSILILGSLLTSCGGTKKYVQGDLVVHEAYIKCPEATAPKYEQLILGEYLLGPRNSEVLINDLELKEHFLSDLKAEVKCYRMQAR